MNTSGVYVFGILTSDGLCCEKCHAFHDAESSNPVEARCITEEERIAVAHQVRETAEKITAEAIICDAYGVNRTGFLKGWGQDRYSDFVAKLL